MEDAGISDPSTGPKARCQRQGHDRIREAKQEVIHTIKHLELFVERKLNRDVTDTDQTGNHSTIEASQTFRTIDPPYRIKSMSISHFSRTHFLSLDQNRFVVSLRSVPTRLAEDSP